MVGVIMRDDNPSDRFARQGPGQHRLPDRPRCAPVKTGIDHRPAIAIVESIDIDMIQRRRQRQAQPEDARGNFGRLTPFGGPVEGIADAVRLPALCRNIHHGARSPADNANKPAALSRASAKRPWHCGSNRRI